MDQRSTPTVRQLLATTMLAVVMLCAPAVQAQKLKERMADRHAEVFDYPKVAAIYENLEAKGKAEPTDLRKLALIYRKMGDPIKAEQTYMRLMGTGSQTADDVFNYAEQLRANGKYTEAIEWYGNHAALAPEDERSKRYVDNPGFFDRLMRDSTRSTVRKLPINSPQADLGPAVLDDLLLFASARGEGVGGSRIYAWDQEPFLNLYSALLKGETAEEPLVMRKDVNSRYHDGTVSFDSTAQRLYFTRNNAHYGVLNKTSGGQLNLGIYYADVTTGEFGQQEWGNVIPFEHNDPEVNYGHPSVSPDGSKLYFVSDRAGGMGGTDIWFCDKLGSQWGVPQNMGEKVNSPGNEMFPYVSLKNTLYFASDGHPGLGGLDLFMSRITANGPGTVFNLGYPMNTSRNDHGLILVDDSTGFFSSNRPGGMGSDDVYGCTVRPPMMYLAGRVINKETKEPIEDPVVLLKGDGDKPVANAHLENLPGGRFTAEAEYNEVYLITANKNGYFQGELKVATDFDPLEDLVIELVKYDYAAEGLVMHGETGELLEGAKVTLTDGQDNVVAEIVTDATGKYQFPLVPNSDFRIRVEKPDFFKQSVRITTKDKASALIKTDFSLFPLVVDQAVRLENIFYDYNKADIRPDAALELDKLVAALQENPTVKIELSSHTDCRGKDSYNLRLSDKRAKSAVDYLISKGIDKSRVKSKGYGESKPSEGCKCTECSEDEHQRNRRTEFKVLSM